MKDVVEIQRSDLEALMMIIDVCVDNLDDERFDDVFSRVRNILDEAAE